MQMARVNRSEIKYAREVLTREAQTIANLLNTINAEFIKAVDLVYTCGGKIVVTGMGKAGIIARKISATLSSTGTPSLFLHPAEAYHGDLGRLAENDVLCALSNSGETEEITRLLESVKKIGSHIIAITGNPDSTLARHSEVVLDLGRIEEACPLRLAPSCSTAAMLALGDALALTVLRRRKTQKKFAKEDYAFYHPGGELGRSLLKVEELMREADANPLVPPTMKIREVIEVMTKPRTGAATVVDKNRRLLGIFTDGDFRRLFLEEPPPDMLERPIETVMVKKPRSIRKGKLATEALAILKKFQIDQLPVVDGHNRVVGLIDVQDLLAKGIV
jgi:arabinose-5-phosphate isomerase